MAKTKGRAMKKVWAITISLLVAVSILSCNKKSDYLGAGELSAPNFRLKAADGSTLELADYKGKVIILDFWATWCPPCRREIPGFVQLYQRYRHRGLVVIGVSLDQYGWRAVKPFIQSYRVSYPVVLGNQRVADLYGGIQTIPTTFIIDRNGNIVDKVVGYHSKSYFEKKIKNLLSTN